MGYCQDREEDTLEYFATVGLAIGKLRREGVVPGVLNPPPQSTSHKNLVFPAHTRGREREQGARRVDLLSISDDTTLDRVPLVCLSESGEEYYTSGPSLFRSKKQKGMWCICWPK